MIIEETKIPDITDENVDKSKVELANKIIGFIQPLLDNEYKAKAKEVRNLKIVVEEKKKKIEKEKAKVEELMSSYNRKKKVAILLDRISKLVNSGIVLKDGNLKNELTILLRVIEDLPESKVDNYLTETVKIISKRFAKSS